MAAGRPTSAPRNPALREQVHGIAVQSTRYDKVVDAVRKVAWHLHHHVQILLNRARNRRGNRRNVMACITLNDLTLNLALDRKAMAAIRGGGGAPWVYGWIQPYVRNTPSMGPVVNLYEVSNNFYANQMINQFQSVDVYNTGANSNIAVSPDARSRNDTV